MNPQLEERARRRADRLIEEACAYLEVAPDAVRGPLRCHDLVAARWLCCDLLRRAGFSPAAIARALGKDHSTVVHALRKVEATPALAADARRLAAHLALTGGARGGGTAAPGLARLLLRATIGRASLREVRAVRAYVLGALLARERADPLAAAAGLLVIGARPAVRAGVDAALAACDLPAYRGLLALHLERLRTDGPR